MARLRASSGSGGGGVDNVSGAAWIGKQGLNVRWVLGIMAVFSY